VEINGGQEQIIELRTTQYALAALASLALLEFLGRDDYDVVKIWQPHVLAGQIANAGKNLQLQLLHAYGPYFYSWDGHQLGVGVHDERRW
jgi:hypothetical protein